MHIIFFAGVLLSLALGLFAWRQTRSLKNHGAARVAVSVLLLSAALLVGFAFWGQYTLAGGHAFDEMDGLYPFVAGPLGTLLAAVAALTGWFARRRSRPDG
jgi:TRAP-type C4-dicarboxylate transport system permease small subunit